MHGFARVTSDYIYRSYSKSGDRLVLQAQIASNLSFGFHAGLGASAIHFGDAEFEINPYLGMTETLAQDWRIDGVLAGYWFDHAVFGQGSSYFEPTITMSFRDLASLKLGAAVEPYGVSSNTPYVELGAAYPVTDITSVAGTLGYEQGRSVSGYNSAYWNLGLTHYFNSHCAVDLRYYGANRFGAGAAAPLHERLEAVAIGSRLVIGVSVGF